jgi:hypothetical protein
MRHPTYHGAQERFVIENAKEMTVNDICYCIGLEEQEVRNIGSRNGLTFKKAVYKKPVKSKKLRPVLAKKQEGKSIFKRPPSEYSNTSPWGISSQERKL